RLQQRVACPRVSVRVGVEKVDTCEAVDLKVDEAGHCDAASVRRGEAVVRYRTICDRDVARYELTLDEGGLDSELHRSSALRMTPFAASSRSFAVSASVCPSSVTIATLASPPLAVSAVSIASAGSPVACRRIRRTLACSFSLVA